MSLELSQEGLTCDFVSCASCPHAAHPICIIPSTTEVGLESKTSWVLAVRKPRGHMSFQSPQGLELVSLSFWFSPRTFPKLDWKHKPLAKRGYSPSYGPGCHRWDLKLKPGGWDPKYLCNGFLGSRAKNRDVLGLEWKVPRGGRA